MEKSIFFIYEGKRLLVLRTEKFLCNLVWKTFKVFFQDIHKFSEYFNVFPGLSD